MTDQVRLKYLRIALIVFGVICIAGIYLMMHVWPPGWVWTPAQHEYEQMILGVYATLGVFLVIAAKEPARHLSLIRFTIWSSLIHGGIMFIQALLDETERPHLLGDIPALFVMAMILWVLIPKNANQF